MKEVYLLTTYLFKSFLKDTFKEEKSFWNTILKVITGAIILILFLFFTVKLYFILSTGNIEYLLIPLILTLASISFMIIGIYLILSNFSFADDNEFLLSLPLSKRTLFISKFLFVEINLVPISIWVVISLFTYGILSKASIIFYIYSLIASLLISVTPIVYGIFITLILSRLSIKSKSKESIQRIFTIVAIILSIGMVYFAIKSFMSPESVLALISKNNIETSNFINIIFPLQGYLTKALTFSNLPIGLNSIVLSIILGAFFITLSIFIGKKLYYKILLNSSHSSNSSDSKKDNFYKENKSILSTLIKRDFLALLRSSQFFLYTIGIFPIFILIVCTFIPILESFLSINGLKENYILAYIYLMYLSSFFASFNVTASTSFSREGRYLPLLLQMPINIKTILFSKIIIALSLSGPMIIVNLVMLAFLNLPILVYIFMGASMFVFTLFIVMISILNDVNKPNIKWCYEKDLVKDNMSLYKSCIYPIVYVPCVLVIHLVLNKTALSYTNQFYLLATTIIVGGIILTIKAYKKIFLKINTLYNL
ncbi:putative ABC transporter permease subunit [Clostridium sp. LIBA-8841]|uniref:putative ABC transporter permease subunit n=1 Tax=Clostridium sp. LIBA-8841 TaxID=2987530 RepID=UPI002AC67016|nr:hypothetical protein [Clostridium sp. LIBA-8841]MDZ5253707.1 hypothetical protein [Clostridium sp. LIBA-8841]